MPRVSKRRKEMENLSRTVLPLANFFNVSSSVVEQQARPTSNHRQQQDSSAEPDRNAAGRDEEEVEPHETDEMAMGIDDAADDAADEPSQAGSDAGVSEGEAAPASTSLGAARKAVLQKKRRKKSGPFYAEWLIDPMFEDWLVTEPAGSYQEWMHRLKSGGQQPEYVYCIGCSEFRGRAPKDVVTKRRPGSRRIDKLRDHARNPKHQAAMRLWYHTSAGKQVLRQRQLAKQQPAGSGAANAEDAPILGLIRTVITIALAKCSLRLIEKLVALQKSNKAIISNTLSRYERGVQTFLHAAAQILISDQTSRIKAGQMYSLMGDGSTDRKTIEQVCQHSAMHPAMHND